MIRPVTTRSILSRDCRAPLAMFLAVALYAGPVHASDRHSDESQNAQQAVEAELDATRALRESTQQELELDERQAEAIERLFDEYLQSTARIGDELKEEMEQSAERKNRLREELDEARKSGDVGKMRKLNRELTSIANASPRIRRARKLFDSKVTDRLEPKQVAIYRRLAAKHRNPPTGTHRAISGLASLHRTLQSMDLSAEQREHTLKLYREFAQSFARARKDADERERLVEDLRTRSLEILTEEQRAEFEELESQMNVQPRKKSTKDEEKDSP